jgi:hypothetical protein
MEPEETSIAMEQHGSNMWFGVFYAVNAEVTWSNLCLVLLVELQLKGAGQRGQVPLDTKAKDSTLIKAVNKQCDWAH